MSYAAEEEIDLILIGAHGERFKLGSLFGSNTDRVLRESPCPVLVLRSLKPSARFVGLKGEGKGVRTLVEKFYKILESRKRRRALVSIRQEFASAEISVDHFQDSQIEGALIRWNDDITAVILNAKTIYRALKQLGHVTRDQRKTQSVDESFER